MRPIPQFPDKIAAASGGIVGAADAYGAWLRSFYDTRAKWHRRFYRFSGVMVILTGASLPVLTNLEYPGKTVVISLAGVVVAGLTGLRAFYRWDQSWILLRNTELVVTSAYLAWKTAPGNLPSTKDEKPTDEQEKAAHAFIDKLGDLREREAAMYFKDMAFPDMNGSKI